MGDGGLIGALSHERHHVFEVLGVMAPGRAQGTCSVRTRSQRGHWSRRISD